MGLAEIRESGRRQRKLREKARAARRATGKAYIKTSAHPTKVLPHPISTPKPKRIAHAAPLKQVKPNRTPLSHASRPAKAAASAASKVRGAGGAGYNLVAVNNTKSRSAPSFNGGYSTAYKAPDGAIRGTPSTSSMVRQSSKALPLASVTPPMPRGKVTKSSGDRLPLGTRIKAAFAANAGNNQALAKKRMLATNRKDY